MNRSLVVKMGYAALAVTVIMAVVTAMPDPACAADGTLGSLLKNFKDNQLAKLAPVISAVCWIGGFILMVSGGMKLKAHGEDPSKEKLAPGVARLLLGVFLVALPFVSGILTKTAGVDGTGRAAYVPLVLK